MIHYIDNSWHKQITYFCVDIQEMNIYHEYYKLYGMDQAILRLKRDNNIHSQIKSIGSNIIPLTTIISTQKIQEPAVSKGKSIKITCFKIGESIAGLFKTCSYSCGGNPASYSIRIHEFCEFNKKF